MEQGCLWEISQFSEKSRVARGAKAAPRRARAVTRARSEERRKAESDEREKAGAPGGLTGLFSLREQFVKTKRDSVDRDNKATLPLTSARFVFKSSASESSNRVKKL